MPSFSTRSVILFNGRSPKKRFSFEERITVCKARNEREAIRKSESEAKRYAKKTGGRYLGFLQAYRMFEDLDLDGVEVFSLIRESDLPPKKYIDAHFDTGDERERKQA